MICLPSSTSWTTHLSSLLQPSQFISWRAISHQKNDGNFDTNPKMLVFVLIFAKITTKMH
jgi:hypothetical protein